MRLQLTVALGSLLAVPAHAADVTVSVQIPQLRVAEYHRPYVAVFVEDAAGKHAANLSVWYLSRDTAEGHGTKAATAPWWRKSAALGCPSTASPVHRPPAPTSSDSTMRAGWRSSPRRLRAGGRTVREVGGREPLRIPSAGR